MLSFSGLALSDVYINWITYNMLRTSLRPTDLRQCVLLSFACNWLTLGCQPIWCTAHGSVPRRLASLLIGAKFSVHGCTQAVYICIHVYLSPHLFLYIIPMHPDVLNVCMVKWEGGETIQTQVETGQI